MCGICGIVERQRSDAAEDATRRMVAAMSHRGPDDHGNTHIPCDSAGVWLGNTRLAILDLSPAGHQPMHDPETGNWIVHNGEVYNFLEVRQELARRGLAFHSRTDTEVILKAYRLLGRDCLAQFRGMFAFAIWDAANRELFIARDRCGKKPLYYASLPSGDFLFASEVRALLASELMPRRLDAQALEVYLTNGFLVSPTTILAAVKSLLPGHWMRVGADGRVLETKRYWHLPTPQERISGSELLPRALQKLAESVRLRMISDVPLGAFLSGGLDSSAIVAAMKKAGGDVRTFSVTFEESAYDEAPYSRWVAGRFGTQHTEVRLTKEDFYALVPAALAAMDQPSYDGVNTFCVAQAARRSGLKVALSGLGADELFGGYAFFNSARLLSRLRKLLGARGLAATRLLRDQLLGNSLRGIAGAVKGAEILSGPRNTTSTAHSLIAAFQTAQTVFPSWARTTLRHKGLAAPEDLFHGLPGEYVAFLLEETSDGDIADGISKLAQRLFLGERCLRDTDTMSMGVSLEVRAPFTDHEFVSLVCACPGAERAKGAPNKPFLRELVEPLLTREYPQRCKQGFIFPFDVWLQDKPRFSQLREEATTLEHCRSVGLEPKSVAQLFDKFCKRPDLIPSSRVWAIFALLDWCRRHRVCL